MARIVMTLRLVQQGDKPRGAQLIERVKSPLHCRGLFLVCGLFIHFFSVKAECFCFGIVRRVL